MADNSKSLRTLGLRTHAGDARLAFDLIQRQARARGW